MMKQSVICSQLSHQEGSNVENNKDSKVKTISYSNNEIISSNVPDVDQKETKRIFSHINDFTRPQRKYKIFSFEIKKLCLDEVFLCFFICIFNS